METTPAVSPQDGYQKLGRKTLLLFISEQIGAALIILIAAVVVTIVQLNGGFATKPLAAWSGYVVLGAWLLFALILIVTLLAAYLSYIGYEFMLDDDALKIRRGILSKEEIAIPYRQIQDVDIDQSFSDRMWGVARLAILTAGHEGEKNGEGADESEGVFPAIDRVLAESLQTELLKRADVEKVTNEK